MGCCLKGPKEYSPELEKQETLLSKGRVQKGIEVSKAPVQKNISLSNDDRDNNQYQPPTPSRNITPLLSSKRTKKTTDIEHIEYKEERATIDNDSDSDSDEYERENNDYLGSNQRPLFKNPRIQKTNRIEIVKRRDGNINPFITNINLRSQRYYQSLRDNKRIKSIQGRNSVMVGIQNGFSPGDNDDDKMEEKEEQSLQREGVFEFGELFSYWDKNDDKYVEPLCDSLKQEIMNFENAQYLKEETWNELWQKATKLKNKMYATRAIQPILAKNKPYYNKLFGIGANEEMTMDHIMAIILYTDCTKLQKSFKEQTRKMHKEEKLEDISYKNRAYAHWFRLLYECIWLFGDELNEGGRIYHGISCKLLFNTFQYDFKAPLSTTRDIDVAATFCNDGKDGIILELRNGETYAQPYFDVKHFSEYKHEKEYIFYGSTLKITSIIMKDPEGTKFFNYKHQIDTLNFYVNIITGSEIERYKSTQSRNNDKHIKLLKKLCYRTVKLINNHIKVLQNDVMADLDDYQWRLFKYFTESKKIIWININEIKFIKNKVVNRGTNIELAKKFIVFDNNDESKYEIGEYLKLLQKTNRSLKIMYAMEYLWDIDKQNIDYLINDNGEIICDKTWDYCFDNTKDKKIIFEGRMVAGYDQKGSNQQGQEIMVGLYWILKHVPSGYQSIIFDVEIYCPQIEFYMQMFDVTMSLKDSTAGHTTLFPINQIRNFDKFKWRIIMKPRLVK